MQGFYLPLTFLRMSRMILYSSSVILPKPSALKGFSTESPTLVPFFNEKNALRIAVLRLGVRSVRIAQGY